MTEQLCSRCEQHGRHSVMRVTYQNDNQTFYKCPYEDCGHMILIQEFERNSERKPKVKQ